MRPVTISSKYRITIPPEIRKQFGIKPGDKVSFIPYDNSLEMVIVSSVKNGHESERKTNLSVERKRIMQEADKED